MKKIIISVITLCAILSCVNKTEKNTVEKTNEIQVLKTNKNVLGTETLTIKNGITSIDLNNDKIDDMIVKGFRNNITPHSFSSYSFYISDKNYKTNKTPKWNIVSIGEPTKTSINTNEGADGILSDICFIKNENGQFQMVQANRAFGKSYADAEIVSFDYYNINFDEDENNYMYKLQSQKKSKQKYIDVKEAINAELK